MTGVARVRTAVFAGVLAAGWLAGAPMAADQAGRALTIEDYYRVLSVGGVSMSPDGAWVVYTVSARMEDDNGTRTESWMAATDGASPLRRVQHEGGDVSAPSWMPNGRLRYTYDRLGWSIDPARPAAPPEQVPVATAAGRGGGRGGGAASGGIPAPDGRSSVSLRDRPAPPEPRPAMTDFEKRHEERFKGATFDWMLFQRDGQPFPAPDPTRRPAQQIVFSTGSAADRVLVDLDLRPTGVVWHPAGAQLAFTADPAWRDETLYDRSDIWTVSVDGRLTRLTDDLYVHSDLDFSPDGKYLSYARGSGTDMIVSRKLDHGGSTDLFIRPVAGGDPINLTADWDLDPGQTTWAPDGRHIYFTAGIGGESHLFRVAVPDGPVEQVTKGERRITGLSFDRAMTRMAYTVGLHEAPADVYVARIDGTGERRLTNVHASFTSDVTLSRAERLQWKSYDGTPIEGWLMFPHGYDPARGRYPLIVFSHGGPHAATGYSFDFKKQFFAANGYFVLDTNFRSSTGYGDAFKWATWGAWGTKDGEDVMSGIDHVLGRFPVDPRRVGHTGHSYGGFLTNWLITQYPDRFAAAVSGAGISNWISDYGTADIFRTKETEFFGTPWDAEARERMIRQSPLTYADRVRTPTLFVHGEVDQRVPYEEAEQMYFALKRRGVPAKMIQYAGQAHGISGHWNNVHRMLNELRWWDTYLRPEGHAR